MLRNVIGIQDWPFPTVSLHSTAETDRESEAFSESSPVWTWSIIYPLFLGVSTVLHGAYGDSKFRVTLKSAPSVAFSFSMIDSPSKPGEMSIFIDAVCKKYFFFGLIETSRRFVTQFPDPQYRYNDAFSTYDLSGNQPSLVNWKDAANEYCDVKLRERDMLFFVRHNSPDVYYTRINGYFETLERVE
ncbi:hypothetical protein FOZ60_000936 [Perkinsus olseni]|uniref:Uncharacterized protein n=1 Tax=Perkinsus olseni TaxID=32597 RepID=A0A7J6PS03_PEROL|nr:hypothetical protein FOZ60_000936 [Perkinsus olseni]KAF4698667.1 hypothetical protein FOZ62_024422 [Perkinsus olseni]